MVTDWIAAGLDPERSTIFIQSMVPDHAELHLLLSMITPLGWLERVPTYKEQIQQIENKDLATYGFLGYPVLQTVDIAIYRAHFVPVGEDQASHLEISREIVRRFNYLYSAEVFPEPQALFTPTPKVPGIDGRKMSKSYGNAINLSDSPEVIRQKCMQMFTDPQRLRRSDPGRPEVCNLYDFHKLVSPPEVQERVASRVPGGRDRLRRRQEAAGADPHRLPGADPPPPRGAAARPRHGLRHPRRGLEQGAGARPPRPWSGALGHGARLPQGPAEGGDGRRMSDETMPETPLRSRRSRPPAAPKGAASGAEAARPARASLLPEAWHVHLPIFEGPLDLLLHLIKLNRVEITDIPVAHDLRPVPRLPGADGGAQPRRRRRVHLRGGAADPHQVQDAAAAAAAGRGRARGGSAPGAGRAPARVPAPQGGGPVVRRGGPRCGWGSGRAARSRCPPLPEEEDATIDLGEVSLFDLLGALKTALVRYDREHPPPLQLSLEDYSVRGQFDRLLRRARRRPPLRPDRRPARTLSCRAEAIAAFLAVLELARLNLVRVHQTESGDILLYRTTRELGDHDREAIGA